MCSSDLRFSPILCSEMGLGVNMKVVGMDVSFPMALVSPQPDIYNVGYDPNTTRGSTQSCISSSLKKINLSTTLRSLLDLSFFMKVVGMDVSLEVFHLDRYKLSNTQYTTQGSAQSCNLPRFMKTIFFHPSLYIIGSRSLHEKCRYEC